MEYGKHSYKKWPTTGLQSVTSCPVCGGKRRKLLYEGLVDNVYRTAHGTWNMYQCESCNSGYLDPCPTRETIGLAYKQYFTHKLPGQAKKTESLSRIKRWRRALANGYLNNRFSTELKPENRIGACVARLMPPLKRQLDFSVRFLSMPKLGARLLDIGCGNGAFLSRAAQAGWEVYGVEPDPKAAALAKEAGVNVRQGSVEAFSDKNNYFDAVTLSHVIEHLHDPVGALLMLKAMMKPGGVLYLETPNLDSLGHKRYGRNWRGLEPPRHLVIFTFDSLVNLLSSLEFHTIKIERRIRVALSIYPISEMLESGLDPYADKAPKVPIEAYLATAGGIFNAKRLEFITLTARA